MSNKSLNHLYFDPEKWTLNLLDQRLLPTKEKIVTLKTAQEVINALKDMVVRGAPAIGVTAAFACVLAARNLRESSNFYKDLSHKLSEIKYARPTAVNLAWAVKIMQDLLDANQDKDPETICNLYLKKAGELRQEDQLICQRLGANGAALLNDGDTILTHCNAGALATAGFGTALGVIRAATSQGKKISVIADETRPFLQGARLTAYELKTDDIPVMVACDNACALLMRLGKITAVIVGADRIAKNGDTANKIGTFGVAILAQYFKIPFYVAAPLSTIDQATTCGTNIPIEKRPSAEVTNLAGKRLVPQGVEVFNYAFDVTPAALITAIITEVGILKPPYDLSIAQAFAAKN